MTLPDSLSYPLEPLWVPNYNPWPQQSILRLQVTCVLMILTTSLGLILGSSTLDMLDRSSESALFTDKGCKQISLERIDRLWVLEVSSAPCLDMDSVWTVTRDSACYYLHVYIFSLDSPSHHHPRTPFIIVVVQSVMAPVRHSRLIVWAYNLCDLFFKCCSCWGWVWVISRIGFLSPCTSTKEDDIFHPVFLPLLVKVLPIKRQGSHGLIITAGSVQPL